MRRLLSELDEKGPFQLKAIAKQDMPTSTRWCVMLVGPGETAYKGWFGGPTGEITMWRGAEQDAFGGMLKPTKTLADEEKLRRWTKRIGFKQPTRLITMASDGDSKASAYFAILVKGYPFVSYPEFGYRITLSLKDGRFIALTAHERLPSIDETPPRLDEAAALDALKRIMLSPASTEARRAVGLSLSYTLTDKPELGYYVAEGKSHAQLVWRLSYMVTQTSRFGSGGGSSAMLIDAVTGEQIHTNLVP